MVKTVSHKPSQKTIDEAMQIARATQKPGQDKEQTKLIAKGIQNGIELYKKQQKAKARAANKAKKQSNKNKAMIQDNALQTEKVEEEGQGRGNYLPWFMLVISWMLFGAYIALT